MVPYFHHWKDDIALVGVAVGSNLPVLTPGPDGNCVTVWVRPVVGGSSSGAGKQLTLGTWEDCSPAAVGRRRRQGVMRGSAQDLSGGDTLSFFLVPFFLQNW